MKKSVIATLVYKEYTENVDMLNPLFKKSELNALIKNDKSIIRVDYYINGDFVGNKLYTENQAIAQILKLNATIGKIYKTIELEYGSDWYNIAERNKKRNAKISDLYDKIYMKYAKFLTEEGFNNSDIPSQFCCNWNEFIN